jgi:hypothetical protein
VALGALAPGIASMSEATLTERGVLPMADYPGALVLLPTMFWGISFGKLGPNTAHDQPWRSLHTDLAHRMCCGAAC